MTLAAPDTVPAMPRRRRDVNDAELLKRVVTEKAKQLLLQDAADEQYLVFQRACWDAYRSGGASSPGLTRSLRAGLLALGFTEEEVESRRAAIKQDSIRRIVEGPRP